MSAHYDLIPLAGFADTPKRQAWLVGMGLKIPDRWENSRNPTPEEVRSTIRQLVDENRLNDQAVFHVLGDDLDAELDDGTDSTIMSVNDYAKDFSEDTPRPLSFEYGSAELVMMVCERLSRICGPFLLTNNGAFFVMVTPGVSPETSWMADDF